MEMITQQEPTDLPDYNHNMVHPVTFVLPADHPITSRTAKTYRQLWRVLRLHKHKVNEDETPRWKVQDCFGIYRLPYVRVPAHFYLGGF